MIQGSSETKSLADVQASLARAAGRGMPMPKAAAAADDDDDMPDLEQDFEKTAAAE